MSQIKLTQFVSGETSEAVVSRMMRARKIAETSTCKQKHGAVLMQGARVLAVGINAFRNDPANLGLDGETPNPAGITVHAEVAATSFIPHRNVPNTTLYVVRYGMQKPYALCDSKPCDACIAHLIWNTQVKEVIYS